MSVSYDTLLERYRAGDLAGAVAGFLEVVAADPRHTPAHYHLGLALHEMGRTAEGIAHYRQLLERHPDYLDAWVNLGDLYGKAGQAESAIAAWQSALALDPESVLILNNLGITCNGIGQQKAALNYFRLATAIEPDRFDFWVWLGNIQLGLGSHRLAEKAYRQALRLNPSDAQVHNNLAVTLGNLGCVEDSIAEYRRALVCDANLADGLNNLALALHKQHLSEEAESLLRRCTEQHPRYALGWANLGMVLQGVGQLAEAVKVIDKALELSPNQAGWLWNQSLAYFTLGDFPNAWQRFEARYDPTRNDPNFISPDLPFPMWQGEALAGKRLLLVKEQGFGDQIQCLRFAHELSESGASVDVWVHPALAGLFASAPGLRQVLVDKPLHDYDYWAYLMSVPARLNVGFNSLPGTVPYLFAPPEKSAQLKQQIDDFAQARLKIALNWAGNPTHPNDHNRSLADELLAPLLAIEEIAWISVQKDRGTMAESWVQSGKLLPRGDAINDFTDTAAMLANVDIVITVDSAVAHLAGAMGISTWLLLPANPDYRWMLERSNSPWYPSTQLWRQPTLGDWRSVIHAMGCELARKTGACFPDIVAKQFAKKQHQQAGQVTSPMALSDPQCLIHGRHGWFVYNRHDQYVGQALAAYGEYAEFEIELFARLMAMSPHRDAIEVGANMGSQTVALANMSRRLYAFEPQPEIFQLLCANLAINNCVNARALPVGVADKSGLMHVPQVQYGQAGNFGGVSLTEENSGTPVFVVTLDDCLAQLAPDLKVGLIKIDVEGMERAVLVGAQQIIARDRPFLYVENDRLAESPALIEKLRQLGYRLYWHCPLLYNPGNFFKNLNNLYPGISAINMLGVPFERAFDTAGMTPVDAAGSHILGTNL